jgi:LPS-assembly lipoprotein
MTGRAEAPPGRAGGSGLPIRIGGALLTSITLAGCGFHPLYAPGGPALGGLRDVYVDIIPNRNGQLLRQALQERLEGTVADGSKRYELSVAYGYTGTSVGIQSDNSSDRTRFVGTATWTLRKAGAAGTKIVSGTAQSVDGVNVIDEQFFYSDLAGDAVQRRMGENLADQIVEALAVYFRTHPEQA